MARRFLARRIGWTAAVALAVLPVLPSASVAARGDLAFEGCMADSGASGCAVAAALDGVQGLGISPDGTSVYAAAGLDSAVTRFGRDGARAGCRCSGAWGWSAGRGASSRSRARAWRAPTR